MKLTINLQNYLTQLLNRFAATMKQIRGTSNIQSSLASHEMSELPTVTPGRQNANVKPSKSPSDRNQSPFQFPPLKQQTGDMQETNKQQIFNRHTPPSGQKQKMQNITSDNAKQKNNVQKTLSGVKANNIRETGGKFSFKQSGSNMPFGKQGTRGTSNPFDDPDQEFIEQIGGMQLLSKEPQKILKTENFDEFDFSDLANPNIGSRTALRGTNRRGRRGAYNQNNYDLPQTSIIGNQTQQQAQSRQTRIQSNYILNMN